MSVILGSTGITFPDSTTQTTAATAGGVTSIVAGTGISVSGTTTVTVNVVNTLGAVGTYAFLLYNNTLASVAPGTTFAGSVLFYSANIPVGCCTFASIKSSSVQPSGTWKAMGGFGSSTTQAQILFVRIS